MTVRLAVGIAALALALPVAASAAPMLQPLKACYVSVGVNGVTGDPITEDVPLSASGFAPNGMVTITVDGVTAATNVPVDASGNVTATPKAPLQERGQRAFDVTLTDQSDASQTISATSLVTAIDVTVHPRTAAPAQRITFHGRGFTAAQPIWAHYVHGRKLRRTVRFAALPTGPCGTFTVRRRQFPFKPKLGSWTLQIDQQRRYTRSPHTSAVQLPITVEPRVKLRR